MNDRLRFLGLGVFGLFVLSGCNEGQSPIGHAADEAVGVGGVPALVHGPPDAGGVDDLSPFAMPGNRMLANGVGLWGETSGNIVIAAPAGVTPLTGILYWGSRTATGDPAQITVSLNGGAGTPVTGDYIGFTSITTGDDSHTFRANLADFGLVVAPGNTDVGITVVASQGIQGATLVLPYTDGAGFFEVLDGNDWIFLEEPTPPGPDGELHQFDVPAGGGERTGTLWVVAGDMEDLDPPRPHSMTVTVNGVATNYDRPFGFGKTGRDGDQWDTFSDNLTIPAGATAVTVQAFSDAGAPQPASYYLALTALSVPDVPPPPPGGGEGCTPGYWKQPHHFDSWTGYDPEDLFSSAFEDAFPGMTLLEVLKQGGGGLKALGRHTVAALLNAAS
ncbi:MAG: hypothetical protein OEO23_11935, partial [Gemmatimonadota bacterium]|nr:hypothetical protein [Gemmatimonadota bacterium]